MGQLLDLLAQPLPHAVLPSYTTRGAADALCFDMDSLMPSLPLDVVDEVAAAAAAPPPPPPPPPSGGAPRRRVPQVLRAHSVAVCRVQGLSYGDEGAGGAAGTGRRPGEPTSAAGPVGSYGGGGGGAKPVGSDVHSTGTAAAAAAAAPGAAGRSSSYSSGSWLAMNGTMWGPGRLGGSKGTKRPGRRPVEGSAAASGLDLMVGGGSDDGTDSEEGEEEGAEAAAATPEVKRQRVEVAAACGEAEAQLGGVVAVRLVEGAVVSAGGVGPDAWLVEVSVTVRAPGEGERRVTGGVCGV